MQTYFPEIEGDIPIPHNADEAFPELSPAEELEMRARTLKLLSDLSEQPLIPTGDNQVEALEIAKKMVSDPKARPDFSRYPNETIAYLAGMVAQSNHMIVNELSDLKLYVVNKLVMEVENADNSKTRISALQALGNVDGVDAFKKRSELTVKVQPIEEVEKELLNVLESIEYSVIGEDEGEEDGEDAPEEEYDEEVDEDDGQDGDDAESNE